jgi:hypothetical protein
LEVAALVIPLLESAELQAVVSRDVARRKVGGELGFVAVR